jgi:CPA1 family monovalent cation:H+ antiporter
VDGAFTTLAIAGVVSVILATLLRSLGISTSLPLIGAGFLLSIAPFGPTEIPEPELILVAILVPLVFGEALGSSYLDLRKVARPVLVLAIGLVVVTTVSVGVVGAAIAALPLAIAMALGAILAPTDAVSVSAVARRASLPRRLVSVLEGESLVNDGTGLTALKVATVAAVAGSITIADVGIDFTLAVVVGISVGIASGYVLAKILRYSKDLVAANSVVIVTPFVVYLLAEIFEGSGILAIVVAGLFVAHQQNSEPGAAGRVQSAVVWRHITFILQSIAFFLIGLELPAVITRLDPDELVTMMWLVPAVVVTLIVVRGLFVLGMVFVTRVSKSPAALGSTFGREAAILAWAGARGPISGLAAFSIPLVTLSGDPFPYRDLILASSFVVIVITLLLAETLGPVARMLKIPKDDDTSEIARVELILARAALNRLDSAIEEFQLTGDPLAPEAVEALRREIDSRLAHTSHSGAKHNDSQTEQVQLARILKVAISMVHAEQEELIRIRDNDGLPDAIMRPMLRELDSREQALTRQKGRFSQ